MDEWRERDLFIAKQPPLGLGTWQVQPPKPERIPFLRFSTRHRPIAVVVRQVRDSIAAGGSERTVRRRSWIEEEEEV